METGTETQENQAQTVDIAPASPQKVTFSEAQQARLNEIVRECQGRAAHDLRAELASVKEAATATAAELALYRDGTSPELIAAREQLAKEKTARSTAEARQQAFARDIALRDALAKEAVINVSDACKLLAPELSWKDGQLVGADGRPLSALVADFVVARPYLVRSTVRSGAGSVESSVSLAAAEHHKLSDLFGRGSNGKLANDLAMKRPAEYARLRAHARAEGLIA